MADDASPLLLRPGQKARHVLERDERDIESVAETDEASSLDRGVDVEDARENRGLVGHNPHGAAFQTREADD